MMNGQMTETSKVPATRKLPRQIFELQDAQIERRNLVSKASFKYEKNTVYVTENPPGQMDSKGSDASWRCLIERIFRKYEKDGETILFDMGHRFGSDVAAEAKQGSLDPTRALMLLAKRCSKTCLGEITFEGDSAFGENLSIKVRNCPFCSETASAQPACFFTKGIVSGLSRVLYGRAFRVTETNCVATGGYLCEFVIEEENFSAFRLA
jgi:predicted hydrocarbon binding protein